MFKYLKSGILALSALTGVLVLATPIEVSAPKEAVPPNIITSANKPMIMLTASKDHLLFGPVFTDFEDLDGDGVIDTTFKPDFKYYGYFDSTKCYSYSSNQFNPAAMATATTTTTGTVTSTKYSCSAADKHWSGNFLNWASMTRLDTVRKMLYGGYRSTDTNGSTVLMGSRLVWDAHSFVKYYKGEDIRDYTPFSKADLTKTTGANANVYAGLSICVTGNSQNSKASEPIIRLVKGNVRFWSTVEIQLCRWRDGTPGYTKGTFGPKLARFYKDADKGNGGINHEVTIPRSDTDGAAYSGIGPDLNLKVKVCDPNFLGEERCQAFPPGSTTNLKPYGLLQEFGYPQNAGDAARVEFGLITGSYDKKNTAGALRKNIRDLEDEINRSTGVFCHSASSGCAATLSDGRKTGAGAIKAFDSIILYGRNSGSDDYDGGGNTPSASGETNLPAWGNPIGEMLVQALQYYAYNGSTPTPTNPPSTSADTNAGMPVSAWSDPLANTPARSKYGNSVCRPLNILAFSSSALSFDGQADALFNTLPGVATAGNLDFFVNKIGSLEGINGTSRSVGSVKGKGLTTADDQNSCSAKTVGNLSDVNGICPESPAMGGTYQVAGAAFYGNSNKIRTLASPPSDLGSVENALKVKTMAASLSGGAPRIDVPVPGTSPQKYVYITPESVQDNGKVSAPLTFASISSGPTYGAFIVTWNDILMGGDYDMDITGFLRYDLVANPLSSSGWDINITTDIPGVCGGGAGTHGFSVIGVIDPATGLSGNGRYLTHQHLSSGKLNNMPDKKEYLCGDDTYRNTVAFGATYASTVCNVTGNGASGDPAIPSLNNYCTVKNQDYLVTKTFRMVGETNALIKDPLWYAGKYGYFKSSVKNADGTWGTKTEPTSHADWDSVDADGKSIPDDVPDGYFLARRPEILEAQLRIALNAAAKASNAAPATSTAQLTENGFKYLVKFDSTTVQGTVEAYKVNSEGDFGATANWEAGALLSSSHSSNAGTNRQIITNSGGTGLAFRWGSLPAAYKTQMTTASTNTLTAVNAEIALNYIRGDQSREGPTGLRERGNNLLGPVVNATPWVQGPPSATFPGASGNGYSTFRTTHKDRARLLWVAANDGMLHAFNPTTGAEVFSYIPGALANRLAEIPLQRSTTAKTKLGGADFVTNAEVRPTGTVWPYVDGSPFTADVKVGSGSSAAWKTYVFGSLGRGGKAVYALDATTVGGLAESSAASAFKWQFTSDDDEDLGYIVADISKHATTGQALPVVKMNDGKFALLLGNGQKSKNGKTVLYVVYVDGPSAGVWTLNTHYRKIVVDASSGGGLSMPRWEDIDGNGTADVAYAGDMKGNLWKFNLGDTNPANWVVAYKSGTTNKPLYQATYTSGSTVSPLPITTSPQLLYMGKGGFLVTFATGNAFETGDFPATGLVQRAYGIWDRVGMGSSRALPTDLTTLAARTYTRNATTGVVTVTSSTPLDWTVHDGWYMNLPGTSEAVLSDPSYDAGVLSFVGVRPKTATTECSATPNTSLFTIDPISGKAERNTQGTVTSSSTQTIIAAKEINDQKVAVVNDRTTKPFSTVCKAGDPGCTCVGSKCTKAATCNAGQRAKRIVGQNADAVICSSASPRLQWREIPGLRTNQ